MGDYWCLTNAHMSATMPHMWTRASASQIDSWTMCNRRWWFDKVAGREDRTGSPQTLLGSEVHQAIEDYLNGTTNEPDHLLLRDNTFVREVRADVDAGRVTILVEQEFTDEALPALGYIDLVIIDDAEHTITVIDHKTSGNLKYTKGIEALASDTQGRLYTHEMFKRFGPSYEYFFGHHVICTKGTLPEGRLTIIPRSHEEIRLGYEMVTHQVASMRADSQALDHSFVDTNYNACFKFPPKGCPHKNYCKQGLSNNTMGLSDMIVVSNAPTTVPDVVTYKTIYLDCLPSRGPVTYWDQFIETLAAAYAQEKGEHYLLTAYSEGAKAVARKAWELLTIPDGLMLRSSDPAAILFANLARTDGRYMIVQGVR